ncbi:MAG: hypothetical protein K9N21_18610 [Deltaproteobacteria bacterium]|nr:hypothetical protein [Deltaproteobacteria bacterium]
MTEKNINALLAIFFIVLVAGLLFHESETFAGSLLGHSIGIVGTTMIFLTLIYPYRKRVRHQRGRQNPLSKHIFYGLMGPSLVVIHSAHKLDSLIGLLVFLSMLIVVLSGITGRFFFRRISRTLKDQQRQLAVLKEEFRKRRKMVAACEAYFGLDHAEENENRAETENGRYEGAQRDQCEELLDIAQSMSELEYTTTIFDSTKSLFSKWMIVHHVLTLFLFSFVFLHILTVLYYGLRWIPS